MKTKDLILALQEADPSGELECTVHNGSVMAAYADFAYWDGRLQVVERDEKGGYRGKVTERGYKVVIQAMGIVDAVCDRPDMPVEYEIGSPEELARWQGIVEKTRAASKAIERKCELELFQKYVFETAMEEIMDGASKEEADRVAEEFFAANLSPKDKIPKDILEHRVTESIGGKSYETIPSYATMRHVQWGREIDVSLSEDGKLVIRKRVELPTPR